MSIPLATNRYSEHARGLYRVEQTINEPSFLGDRTMKRAFLITIVCMASFMLTGCMSFAYEEHCRHRQPQFVHAPRVRVVEVIPAGPPRSHRPDRHRGHRY